MIPRGARTVSGAGPTYSAARSIVGYEPGLTSTYIELERAGLGSSKRDPPFRRWDLRINLPETLDPLQASLTSWTGLKPVL
jgi:hypothetical protein